MKLKKIASLMLAGIMAVSMLAGCKSGNTNNGNNDSSSSESTVASGVSATLHGMLNGKGRDVLKAADSSALDKALSDAISTYFTDGNLADASSGTPLAPDYKIHQLLTSNVIYSQVLKAMDAAVTFPTYDGQDETNTVVAIYAFDYSTSDKYALSEVAKTIDGYNAYDGMVETSSDKEYKYNYTISASIAVKTKTVADTTVGVKYVAVAFTQNVADNNK